MTRDKSHRQALDDIAEQAADEEAVAEVAFAVFVYRERTDFTHSTAPDADLSAVIDGLSTHVAALSEATGHPISEVLDVAGEAAREKQADGRQEWGRE